MTETLSLFFAMIAVSGSAFVVVMAVIGLLRLTGRNVAEGLLVQLRPIAAPLAFVVATSAMLGSLYYSEVANYTPCRLCWVQRFFMYPSSIIIGLLLLARRPKLLWLPFALSVVGLGVAIYHRMEQAFPDSVGGACSLEVPCSGKYVEQFGFVTIPTMAGAGFALVATFLLIALRRPAE